MSATLRLAPPPLDFFWFIPTGGDGAFLGSETQQRPADFRYFREIGTAVDRLGFDGVLLPTGQFCEDSWVTAASLATATERLKFLVALRPGVTTPAFAARQTAALDRLSEGRLLLNVVVGGSPAELAGDGIYLEHDERYAQAAEFLRVWRTLLAEGRVTFDGRYYQVRDARLNFPPLQEPHPPLWIGGSSEAGQELAADQVSVYLTWGEPPEWVAAKIAAVRARAQARGRTVRFGLRIHLIVRETDGEAWDAADRLISRLSDDIVAEAQRRFREDFDSEGQRRMAALHGGRRDRLEVAPNLWAGIGLIRPGAGTALVGDPAAVAARLRAYQEAGIDTIIASGFPHLEEAYRVAELLFPELGRSNTRTARDRMLPGEFMRPEAPGRHRARAS